MTHVPDIQPRNLDKGQRAGVALLICISVLLIAVSFLQFKSSFAAGAKKSTGTTDPYLTPDEQAKNEEDTLKKTDTDADGLNDYDELHIYHTSPYQRDTDSDGTPDGEEVRRGTSPVCPEGNDCSLNPLVTNDATTSTPPASAAPHASVTSTPAAGAAQPSQAESLKQVREALIANGVPKEKVDSLSDAELMQLLVEAQQEAAKTTKPQP